MLFGAYTICIVMIKKNIVLKCINRSHAFTCNVATMSVCIIACMCCVACNRCKLLGYNWHGLRDGMTRLLVYKSVIELILISRCKCTNKKQKTENTKQLRG